MPRTNTAAFLRAPRTSFEVGPAALPEPAPDEVVVRVRAVAVNPLDWVVQGTGQLTYRWLAHPAVLGTDVAGEVVAIGSHVTRLAVGDRVAGLATGTDKGRDSTREGAFQHYTALLERLTTVIPDGLSFERAAVLPLGVSTAACALFQERHLGLRLPPTSRGGAAQAERDPSPTEGGAAPAEREVVVVWGGSSSVGMNAVQLATAAGYDVLSTASAVNAETVRELGATHVYDYRDPEVVDKLVAVIAGRTVAGAVAIGARSTEACIRLLARTGGTRLAIASTPVSLAEVAAGRRLIPTALPTFARLGLATARSALAARQAGVTARFIWGSSLRDDDLGERLWGEVLPRGLADGSLRPMPEALVTGEGLAAIQGAVDRQRAGVSAQKLVVRL
ncbi:zinc-binding alcohol dehydrogenase family protein [Frigoribacterium sp. CFBP9039]|uniref:zinc-binding alcohol dehydrogenase family protein n=1 Tax=Frigoribacterium sp. CFBP9029 TaxID=3096541 RepID=UPI002A6AD167|nr:zinc-binding alcohol dehydrogenase family protein [Frigoribacterium sp. CFBP9039]MDY0945697.1 zinc-binding alcohol dehydrogenase family protein [Frigoribacterium sp. CFBP9039]